MAGDYTTDVMSQFTKRVIVKWISLHINDKQKVTNPTGQRKQL